MTKSIQLPDYKTDPPYGGSMAQWCWFFMEPHKWHTLMHWLISLMRRSYYRGLPLFFGLLVSFVEMESAQREEWLIPSAITTFALATIFTSAMLSTIIWGGGLWDRISKEVSLFGFRHYLGLSEGWHENQASGEKLQRLMKARESTFMILNEFYWEFIQLPAIFLAVSVSIYVMDAPWYYLFLFTGMIGSYIFFSFITGSWLFRRHKAFYESLETVIGSVYEFVISTATVRFFNLKPSALEKGMQLEALNHKDKVNVFKTTFKRWFLVDNQALFWMVLIISLSSYEATQGKLSIGAFTTIIMFSLTLWGEIEKFAVSYAKMIEHWEGLGRLVEVLNIKPDITDSANAIQIADDHPDIRFDDVSFEYTKAKSVIKDFSLHIKAGEKIGLIGPSGAGKSTIVKLLLRFYDCDKGSVSVASHDVKQIKTHSLQENIAVIPQDVVLFNHPLIENIRYGRLDASDEEVMEAAKKAHAHEFIELLPDGYQTLVGERGVKLSGGQRQRIAIARAILKDAPILLLDEATSALDSESEKHIQESLHDLMEGKTVIAIAHRLSTISHLDRLVVMDEGKILEEGSHEELLKNKDGLYAKLWSMQSGGFLGE